MRNVSASAGLYAPVAQPTRIELDQMPDQPKKPMGLAALSPERRTEIAKQGGKASHASGGAHEWTSDSARDAAAKGLAVRLANRAARLHEAESEHEE